MNKINFKFAYPHGNEITLSQKKLPIYPAFDEEIEITCIRGNILKGKSIHYEHSNITYLDVEEVVPEDIILVPKYFLFGRKVRSVRSGWVRLKKTTSIQIDMKNMIIRKIFKEMENA